MSGADFLSEMLSSPYFVQRWYGDLLKGGDAIFHIVNSHKALVRKMFEECHNKHETEHQLRNDNPILMSHKYGSSFDFLFTKFMFLCLPATFANSVKFGRKYECILSRESLQLTIHILRQNFTFTR